jgi:hypothetical protein
MKKSSLFYFIFLLTFLVSGICTQAQNDEVTIKNLVESQHFIFKAQTALPSGAASRQLESDYYDVRISKDTIISFLPYFGRSYSVGNYGSDGGIKFTSTKFSYSITKTKKGGWDISIKPKDANDVRELSLSISVSRTADLKVISDNRQPISFYGYITTLK